MVRGRGSGAGQLGLCSALLSPTVGPWTHSLLLQASVSPLLKNGNRAGILSVLPNPQLSALIHLMALRMPVPGGKNEDRRSPCTLSS